MFRERHPPPKPQFDDPDTAVLYEHILRLYHKVGRLEGGQAITISLLLAMVGGIIALLIRVFGG